MIKSAFNFFFTVSLVVTPLFSVWAQLSSNKEYKVINIGFYNLENLFDTLDTPGKNDKDFTPKGVNNWTSKLYKEKLTNMASVISKMGTEISPDGIAVLGVAEIENRTVLEDLIREPQIAKNDYGIVFHEGPDERGIDCGFLYQKKYFKPLESRGIFVPLDASDGKGWFTRDILYVKGILDGDTMHFFVNHWPSRRGGELASQPARNKAAGVAKKVIDSIMAVNINSKIVLMGDLNDEPTSPSVTKVLGAKSKMTKTKKGELFNPFHEPYMAGNGTLAYQDSWGLFDQIIISHGFIKNKSGYKYYRYRVFNEPFLITHKGKYKGYPFRTFDFSNYQGGYSDHFPVYLIFLKPKS
jgi:hypothetical protein